MTISEHTGMRIRMYRKHRHMTIEALAHDIDKSLSTVSKYESGQISIDIETLHRIAVCLDVSMNQLTDYREEVSDHHRVRHTGNYFERAEIFYMYQYFGYTGKVYECAIEISRVPGDDPDEDDTAILYYGIKSPDNYTDSEYLYNGHIYYYDSVAYMLFSNPYNRSDKVFVYAKSAFTNKQTTTGIVTAVSSTLRNPYSFKVLFSNRPLKIDDELIEELLISDKESLNDIRRNNALFIR